MGCRREVKMKERRRGKGRGDKCVPDRGKNTFKNKYAMNIC